MTDLLRCIFEFLLACYGWLTAGLMETAEYHAEPWVRERWTVEVA